MLLYDFDLLHGLGRVTLWQVRCQVFFSIVSESFNSHIVGVSVFRNSLCPPLFFFPFCFWFQHFPQDQSICVKAHMLCVLGQREGWQGMGTELMLKPGDFLAIVQKIPWFSSWHDFTLLLCHTHRVKAQDMGSSEPLLQGTSNFFHCLLLKFKRETPDDGRHIL